MLVRQGRPFAPFLYMYFLQIKPLACAITQRPTTEGIQMPNCDQPIECKIKMFADDTHLIHIEKKYINKSKEYTTKASGTK